MFGLVRERRLKEAQKREISLRIDLVRLEERVAMLQAAVALGQVREDELRRETARLLAILAAHPAPAAVEDDSPKPEQETKEHPVPRVLSGIEVVKRATEHRNAHHKAAR